MTIGRQSGGVLAPSAVIHAQVVIVLTGLATDVDPAGCLARAVDQRPACVATADCCEHTAALAALAPVCMKDKPC
jgi:hypothetical protein